MNNQAYKARKWRCRLCEFDNMDELSYCEMCDNPKVKEPKPLLNEDEDLKKFAQKEPGVICPSKSCRHYNNISAETCAACKRPLFEDEHPTVKKEKQSPFELKLKYCYKCTFENDPFNDYCVKCEVSLKKKEIPKLSYGPFGAVSTLTEKIHCEDCGKELKQYIPDKLFIGQPLTYDDFICQHCVAKNDSKKKLCLFCDKQFSNDEAEIHIDFCQARISFFKREGNQTFERCSKLQIDTMYHMHRVSEKLHEKKKHLLLHRIKKLGFSVKDFENMHHYIMHYAPIIIHMNVANFKFYEKDTHYRNQFQVRGGCSARVTWEDRMFDNRHHSATPFERVKYGTMNFTNDPFGVQACMGYGQSYFLLKKHVRDRCTITDMDSSSPASTIATFRFIFHLLIKLNDGQLKAAFEGSKGNQMKSNVIAAYKEIQIHGPVEFSKDIERVYICKQELEKSPNMLELIKSFCEKNKLQYELFNKKEAGMGMFGVGKSRFEAEKAAQRIVGSEKEDPIYEKNYGWQSTHPIKKYRKKR